MGDGDLAETQRWFLDAIRGATSGADSIADRITPSARLGAEARLQIYADAYVLRLVECLGELYPACRRLIGPDAFGSMAAAYLEDHPSTRYTLDALGDHFPAWLHSTRPDDNPDWAGILIEMARLEQAVADVFDGPGVEGERTLDSESLHGLDAEGFASARLKPAPCVRLLRCDFPVNALYTELRARGDGDGSAIPLPTRATERIVLYRRDWVVRRYLASEAEMALLQTLVLGGSVSAGIEAALDTGTVAQDALGPALHGWFADWVRLGFFLRLTAPSA